MISLSRGSLKEIFERNLHADAAMFHCWNEAKHMRVSLYNKASPICIQIVGVDFLSEFNTLLVLLFDGTVHKTAVVDKSMWHRLDASPKTSEHCSPQSDQTDKTTASSTPSIKLGSIVILYEYAFEFVHSFVGAQQQSKTIEKTFTDRTLNAFAYVEMAPVSEAAAAAAAAAAPATVLTSPSVMKLLNFAIIGHDEKLECYQRQVQQQQQQHQPPLQTCKLASKLSPPPPPSTSYVSTLHTFSSDKFNIVDTRGWQVQTSALTATRSKVPIAIESLVRLPIDSESWTIKACVLRIGVLKSFTNRTTGVSGVLQRVLFKDESGLIEAIAFNDVITILNLGQLKRNQSYFVCNAKLGVSPRKVQEWFAHFPTSAVEIKLFGATQIVESSLLDEDNHHDNSSSSFSAAHFVPAESTRDNDPRDDNDGGDDDGAFFVQNDAASFLARQLIQTAHVPDVAAISRRHVDTRIAVAIAKDNSTTTKKTFSNGNNDRGHQPPLAKSTYTKLKEIKDKLVKNDTVNTMGVLVSVGKCESAYVTKSRSSIKVRRIVILDESQTRMSVAIWGAQAQNFASQLDCILILHDVKVAYFDGTSLSIYKQSRLVEYNHVFNNNSAQTLKQWYDSFVAGKLARNIPPAAPCQPQVATTDMDPKEQAGTVVCGRVI